MAANTRSKTESNKTRCEDGNAEIGIEDILRPLRESIHSISSILDTIEKKFNDKFERQQQQIDILMTRMEILEKKAEFSRHLAKLNERKIDDAEQISKKINLRLVGIPVDKNETPESLMVTIKKNVNKLNLDIPDNCYDRCHRDGPKHKVNGKLSQSILLKMCYWRDRNKIYSNRKKLDFKVYPHLTTRRNEILNFAMLQIENGGSSFSKIDFVLADLNCKLKLKTKSGRFYGFNSKHEFMSLVSWLDLNDTAPFNEFNLILDDKYLTDFVNNRIQRRNELIVKSNSSTD